MTSEMAGTTTELSTDVVVVGAGVAGLCAALAAQEAGARRVVVLERAPEQLRGGNSAFAGGSMRVVYGGTDDLRELVPDLTDEELRSTDFGTYPAAAFLDDMAKATDYRTDPDLAESLVLGSLPVLKWLRRKGVRFVPIYGRQTRLVDGRRTFWGGLTLEAVGGGRGLVDALFATAIRSGVDVIYDAEARELLEANGRVTGVRVRTRGPDLRIAAGSVVLAAGGFQADPEWRARYLGPGWETAKVRGSRFNTGSGIRMALQVGAASAGNWSGCHAVNWDRNAPDVGHPNRPSLFQKHSYQFGIMLNQRGDRFIDEGEDVRLLTYSKFGRAILAQPGSSAWQVFDAQSSGLLGEEYRTREVTRITALTLEELVQRMDDVQDKKRALATIAEFNRAVDQSVPFDPNVKDGRAARLDIPKSNWARAISEPPFEAYQVTAGITFTFGGVRVDADGQVLDFGGRPIDGLFACGEMVGGIFHSGYPGGAGLTSAAVFGYRAGRRAAAG